MDYYYCFECNQEVPEIGGYDECEKCKKIICQDCFDKHTCNINSESNKIKGGVK